MTLRSTLLVTQQHAKHPDAVDVRVAGAARVDYVRVRATGLLQCVGQEREDFGATLGADRAGEVARRVVVEASQG